MALEDTESESRHKKLAQLTAAVRARGFSVTPTDEHLDTETLSSMLVWGAHNSTIARKIVEEFRTLAKLQPPGTRYAIKVDSYEMCITPVCDDNVLVVHPSTLSPRIVFMLDMDGFVIQ